MATQIIVVANQKGGVGKTTTVLNVATALYIKQRKKVLVVDMDPQGNATTGAGIDKNNLAQSIYQVLIGNADINSAIVKSQSCGFDLIGANRDLAGAEVELVDIPQREFCLKHALAKLSNSYDVILIDCPPSLSLLTINSLVAANFVIVPIQCEYYALEGLSDLLNTLSILQQQLNPRLDILGILRTMYDKRNNLALDVSRQLSEHFGDKVFYATIPRTVRLAEAPSFGISAVAQDGNALGADAYCRLAREVNDRLRNALNK